MCQTGNDCNNRQKLGVHLKFIAKLTPEEEVTLTEAYRNHSLFRVRQRAHAILLNNRRYVIARLSELFESQHETVSSWLDKWETEGLIGLLDFSTKREGLCASRVEGTKPFFLGYN
ncbi:helix-turn-helix domain-containing protein [Methylobacter tundripaludum]|uniref:helix-turn-helix domain-containing protein n=1 Tax=Methylobacter tundripaludum TaxID=173365 RepID=UPI0020B7D1B7|nr:helix-turn-helix domain-containing protein [Methylobacter tundripaludum]